jgi:hypothetical protein
MIARACVRHERASKKVRRSKESEREETKTYHARERESSRDVTYPRALAARVDATRKCQLPPVTQGH